MPLSTDSPSFLATFLFDLGAIKIDLEKGFRLKLHETNPDAPLSPIYLNLHTPDNPKPGPLDESSVGILGGILWQHAKTNHLKFDAVAGLPNAGTPLAKALVTVAGWKQVQLPYVTLGKTEGGSGRKIEKVLDRGGAKPGETVLVVDDLITRGDSKNEGIEALVADGFKVTDVLVLVDREQGGAADLAERGIRLWSLTTLKKIVRLLAQENKITPLVCDRVLQYLNYQQ